MRSIKTTSNFTVNETVELSADNHECKLVISYHDEPHAAEQLYGFSVVNTNIFSGEKLKEVHLHGMFARSEIVAIRDFFDRMLNSTASYFPTDVPVLNPQPVFIPHVQTVAPAINHANKHK